MAAFADLLAGGHDQVAFLPVPSIRDPKFFILRAPWRARLQGGNQHLAIGDRVVSPQFSLSS
jgi:hypothetical protein